MQMKTARPLRSVATKLTWRHIPQKPNLNFHSSENTKSRKMIIRACTSQPTVVYSTLMSCVPVAPIITVEKVAVFYEIWWRSHDITGHRTSSHHIFPNIGFQKHSLSHRVLIIQTVEHYVWGRREMHVGFWRGNRRERDDLEDVEVDGRTILLRIVKKQTGRTWSGLIWFRVKTNSRML